MSAKVAVLGAGAWGTTYAKVLADAGCVVNLWARRPELASDIARRHENVDYLPGIALPETIHATSTIDDALRDVECVALAVPAQTMRHNVEQWSALMPAHAIIVSLAKGIELKTGARMSEVIAQAGGVAASRIAVVSGPNLAPEIAAQQPAATVIAASDPSTGAWLQRNSATNYLRPYTNTDVIGCELAGAVKNVIALAVGMAQGMGLGDNSKASLITRGLAETMRLGVALGADPTTFAGLAGLGDLVATCSSPLSRNRHFGELLAAGETLDEATGHTATTEGVWSCLAIKQLAEKYDVEMPITEQVVRVCHENVTPSAALTELMSRRTKHED